MGQYHFICNLDKKEYLHPHDFGDGLGLMEFGCSQEGTLLGLTVLLAASNRGGARGGGDLHPWDGGPGYDGREVPQSGREEYLMNEIVGRWAGDRIAIIGDYYEEKDVRGHRLVGNHATPWDEDPEKTTSAQWKNISAETIEAMEMDYYVRNSRAQLFVYHPGYATTRNSRFGQKMDRAIFKYDGVEREVVDVELVQGAVTITSENGQPVASVQGQEVRKGTEFHAEPQFKRYRLDRVQQD